MTCSSLAPFPLTELDRSPPPDPAVRRDTASLCAPPLGPDAKHPRVRLRQLVVAIANGAHLGTNKAGPSILHRPFMGDCPICRNRPSRTLRMNDSPALPSRREKPATNAPRTLLAAAPISVALAVAGGASARPVPLDVPANTPVSVHNTAAGGRTDQQIWGRATWLNPLSGLNLDRTSAAR